MKEAHTNIWTLHKRMPICITTNGSITTAGLAVMGRGVALQARDRFPDLANLLGALIHLHGNNAYYLEELNLFTFPVKHLWYQKANLELIHTSCMQLMMHLESRPSISEVALPRPGCGNGGLTWEEVKPVIETVLDDRVTVVTR